jgi:hypothetical protein
MGYVPPRLPNVEYLKNLPEEPNKQALDKMFGAPSWQATTCQGCGAPLQAEPNCEYCGRNRFIQPNLWDKFGQRVAYVPPCPVDLIMN